MAITHHGINCVTKRCSGSGNTSIKTGSCVLTVLMYCEQLACLFDCDVDKTDNYQPLFGDCWTLHYDKSVSRCLVRQLVAVAVTHRNATILVQSPNCGAMVRQLVAVAVIHHSLGGHI